MNTYLELNGSKKKYQIIPLRTNLTPKFIPISVDSLVDILDSKYLMNNIKNYYHADNKRGLILFETYFNFDSKYIKKTIKKGYVFSGLIYTNGYEINYIFNSKSYENKKNNFHAKGKEEKKQIKEKTNELSDELKVEFEKKRLEEKEKIKNENQKIYQDKIKKNKNEKKEKMINILQTLEKEIKELNIKYQNDIKKIEYTHYEKLKDEFDKIDKKDKNNKKILTEIIEKLNDDFLNKNVFLKHIYDRNYTTLINDHDNHIDEKYNEIKKKELNNENSINEIKNKINKLKKELKDLKKKVFNYK
jgi:archaellum component FlaC